MPTITHENSDELNAVLTIVIAQNDYLPTVNSKLKEYRQKAQIKGFRPGKVPMNFIKRKFGNAVLVEEINELMNEKMNEYFKEHKLRILGQPMAIEDQNLVLSINKPADYTFNFELGLAPEFEVQGMSTDTILPFYDITLEDEDVNREIDNARRKQSGGFEDNVTDIEEEDMLAISLVELDENAQVKENGVTKEETFLALRDVVNKELKDNLLTATIDDSFDINIYNIEDRPQDYIRKHVLSLEDDQTVNETFRLTIKEIKRVKKAELNEAFFNQLFPEQGITTEEDFRNRIKEEIYKGYKQSSLGHYTNLAFDFLLENNQMKLPKPFLRKWIESTNDNVTDSFFDGEEFENFLSNLCWTLVREKLAEQFSVEVKYEDVENVTRGEILKYFNYQIPAYGEMMDGMLEKILSDKSEVNRRFESLMDQRVLEHAAENMGKDMIPVSRQDFEQITKDYQDSKNPVDTKDVVEEADDVVEEVELTEETNLNK